MPDPIRTDPIRTDPIRVVCQQVQPRVGDLRGNLAMAEEAISQAVGAGADVIVLPELVTSGYVFASAEEAMECSLLADSEAFDRWAHLVRTSGSIVVAGFAERDPERRLFNSLVVVGPQGVLAHYRKTHLWDSEKLWFAAGDEEPPVVATHLGRIGMLICYDLEFPEMVRGLALRGADIVVAPANWPVAPRPAHERPPEMHDAMSAARTNHVYIACCDRVGEERGVPWTGGSCIIGPDGWLLAERPDRDAGAVIADIDVSRARDKRINDRNDALADRRPELYASLAQGTQSTAQG